MPDTTPPSPDPTLVRRARLARLAEVGQRTGYALFGCAVIAFFAGAVTSFSSAVVTIVIVALALGSVTLAPAIVLGYAVKAAEREDRERAQPPRPRRG